jgi:hypothetical protein
MNIKDVIHYYIGARAKVYHTGAIVDLNLWQLEQMEMGRCQLIPILRRLESMTEEEMKGLLLSIVPEDMEDAPGADEHDVEMFYNDGGNMVDGDVAVGSNYSCRCYEGQVAIRKSGDIDWYNEDGSPERMVNQTKAFHYLISKGFDLFGLIESGDAIDEETLKQQ